MVEVTQADQALLIDLLELDDEQADRVRAGTAYTAEVEALARHRLAERAAVVAWLRGLGFAHESQNRAVGQMATAIEAGEHHA